MPSALARMSWPSVSGGVRLLPNTGESVRPSTEICATVASGPPVIATIVPEPMRVEAELYCVERSWAPGDTFNFPRLFRAEVMDRVNKKIFAVADKMALQPRRPQAPRTQ